MLRQRYTSEGDRISRIKKRHTRIPYAKVKAKHVYRVKARSENGKAVLFKTRAKSPDQIKRIAALKGLTIERIGH